MPCLTERDNTHTGPNMQGFDMKSFFEMCLRIRFKAFLFLKDAVIIFEESRAITGIQAI